MYIALTENNLTVIAEYVVVPTMKLPDQIDETKLDWKELSSNPAAINILENHPDRIEWKQLSRNPAAIHLLEENLDRIDWWELSRNPAATHILENHPDRVEQEQRSQNSLGALSLDGWNWGSPNMRVIMGLKLLPSREDFCLVKYMSTIRLVFELDQSVYNIDMQRFINDIAH